MNFQNIRRLYFIGIGGSSMNSLAQIMSLRGYAVSGSDAQESYTTDMLIGKGIKVYIGHSEDNIRNEAPEVVVRSEAISETNPEIMWAEKNGVPVVRRAELLGFILDGYKKTIGVAGTHGKTTTTSMITSIFINADTDPSAIIGGKMTDIGSSYLIGSEELCIFESCEYKESFKFFRSDISVILNIAQDHMEYFKTLDNLIKAFSEYTKNVKPNGTLVINADDPNSLNMLERSGYSGKIVTFGLANGHFRANNIVLENGLPSFDLIFEEKDVCNIKLKIPGEHNIKNALAAAAAAYAYGLDFEMIKKGLESFSGVARRFEYHCKVNGAIIADDYGHHPDAYRAVFKTARQLGFKRIIAIHQPHTFSRTKMFMDEFVDVLSGVDKVFVLPIFAARETNDEYNIYAEDVVNKLPNGEYVESFEKVAQRVKETAQPGDIFITLGCGDVNKAAILISKLYGMPL